MFGNLIRLSETIAGLPIVSAVALLALFLVGCGPSPPARPIAISITDVGSAANNGGLVFTISGTGFTPNGKVNARLFNVPTASSAVIELSNGPGLPNLVADGNGNFFGFKVAQSGRSCGEPPGPAELQDHSHVPVDIFLHVIDVETTSVAFHTFSLVSFCMTFPPLPPPVPIAGCGPGPSLDPRCH